MSFQIPRLLPGLAVLLSLSLVATACADPATSTSEPEAQEAASTAEKPVDNASRLPDFTQIIQANQKAVVNISTTREVGGGGPQIPERFKGTPFERFFRRFFGGPDGGGQKREVSSLGSGFIVSSDGHIVTNAHVVKGASEIVVQLSDRRQLEAELLGTDRATDVALLKVDASGLPTVAWSSGDKLEVGDWVLAMGSPFGFEQSATAGIVSAKGRSIPGKAGSYVPFLQTDVAINPGSSGGPLFNLAGEVVGINAQIYSRSGGYMGLSFAIPTRMARDVVAEIKEHGEVRHGYLGVGVQRLNRELAQSMGLDKPRGGLIADVKPDSPAAEAGLQSGDIILAVDGEPVAKAGDIPPKIGRLDPGTEVTLTILRSEERIEKTVTLGSLAEARGGANGEAEPATALGMQLAPVPDQLRQQRSLPEQSGALVKGIEPGPARDAGIRPGDIILKFGDVRVKNPGTIDKLLDRVEEGARVPVLVQRKQQMLYVPLRIP
ncbi:Do family serine endopeptidase [Thiohalorhabdus methylotrophus]|uniref:Probable periplasmic serine endoprotease DegP-like n=1 Tax=Thiohalorhabdus methylotrophus TaxID=3242694 RepID=A0ABV4TVE4_9GAMM